MIMLLITHVNAAYLRFFQTVPSRSNPPARSGSARRGLPILKPGLPLPVGSVTRQFSWGGLVASLQGRDLSAVQAARGGNRRPPSKQASAILLRAASSRLSMPWWTRSSAAGSINCPNALLKAEGPLSSIA